MTRARVGAGTRDEQAAAEKAAPKATKPAVATATAKAEKVTMTQEERNAARPHFTLRLMVEDVEVMRWAKDFRHIANVKEVGAHTGEQISLNPKARLAIYEGETEIGVAPTLAQFRVASKAADTRPLVTATEAEAEDESAA